MEKKICAFLFAISFVALSSVVHGSNSAVHRGPSVDPVVEVDIEDTKSGTHSGGYNFAEAEVVEPVRAPTSFSPKARVPANIVSKSTESSSGSMIGPLIFLIALPIGLWIVVSKKFGKSEDEKKVDYYPKTHQFKPYKTDYQKTAEDDDDIDFPKAS